MRIIIEFETKQPVMNKDRITKTQWAGLHINENVPCDVTVIDMKNYMIELDGQWFYSQQAINDQKNKQWWEFWK